MNIHIFTLVFSLLFGSPSENPDNKWSKKTEKKQSSVSKTSDSDPEHEGEGEELDPNG